MPQANIKSAPFREISFGRVDIDRAVRANGVVLLQSRVPLHAYPNRITERLVYWAKVRPEKVFLAQRDDRGLWREYSYRQTLAITKRIAQWLLLQNVSTENPVAILSENSIEHAMLALAAMHIGIPYSPISPMYSLKSKDFSRLRHVMELLSPGLIFVSDGAKYERALQAVAQKTDVIVVQNPPQNLSCISFDELIQNEATANVDKAYEAITPGTIAKILFTSGSTGLPKGVINTHGNICSNWQQITQTFPFMADEFKIVDWLPWNHTFGGNHNFGLTLYNGGSMHLDGGNPTPEGIEITVRNLREVAPSIYFNVPKGFEELVPYLRSEKELRQTFFSRLQMLFYAGAGMPQPVWDDLEALAIETVGERIVIGTGLGCTESSPSALFANTKNGFSGLLGTPVPGLQLKLAPVDGKMEARYFGTNITPGYWRQPDLTAEAFDEEGFYCTGDALKFVEPNDPNAGMIFDGRLAENFKLNSGTWVNVGVLRAQLVKTGAPIIQDAVLAGLDRQYVSAILFLNADACRRQAGSGANAPTEAFAHPAVALRIKQTLETLALASTGSFNRITRAIIASDPPSVDAGEITDKGTLNQGAVLNHRAALVKELYADPKPDSVFEV